MTPLVFASALSLLAADVGQAAPTAGAPPTGAAATAPAASKPEADNPDKVICRNQVITGSRFSKRICMTRAQWGEQERHTEELSRHLNESAGYNAAGATGGGMTNGQ